LLFADRLHKHFHNDGALTPDNTEARWMRLANQIDKAIIGESARWGDDRATAPYTRDGHWITEQNRLVNTYFPYRSNNVFNQFNNLTPSLYPNTAASVFRINGAVQHGGQVAANHQLTMSGTSGTVYYTLDGSDPRLPGGAVNSGHVLVYSGAAITLSESAVVRARVRYAGEWSALTEAEFFVGPQATAENLVITEINYNPYSPLDDETYDNDDFEYIELWNSSGQTIDLSGVYFTDGITFDFVDSDVTELGPYEFVVVARDPVAFQTRYGAGVDNLTGSFEDQFANGGERIKLLDYRGEPIAVFEYNDGGNWPGRADGKGAAMELIDPTAVPETQTERTLFLENDDNWRSTSQYGGTPGFQGAGPLGDVVINEVLSHTDPPLSDAIELHNTTAEEILIGGWYLSDASNEYRKFLIPPGTRIPGYGYVVFDEDDFNPNPMNPGPRDFALDGAHGEDVWLMEADGDGQLIRFVDHVDFGAAANGESFGRWPDGTGDLYPMRTRTLDPADANSGPRVGPVIISEVHYNPGDFEGASDYEFVEIYNAGNETENLTNWRIRKGVDYDFAPGTQLASGASLVVVSFEPSDTDKLLAFRNRYGIEASVTIVGAYDGRLENAGERVQLQRPDEPPAEDPTYIPRLLEDEVRYSNLAPWPVEADGQGQSLNRVSSDAFGNHSTGWLGALPTPGTASLGVAAEIMGRYLFYNESSFDGNDAGADARDDLAIATDKRALMPGETATFQNYSSFSRGINGVMIDVVNLPPGAALTASDFEFRVGNNDDPSTWALAESPTTIAIRRGAGEQGSDRVTIVWDDDAIANEWLRITVHANANTGLVVEDVFCFGHAVGETGNATSDARVNAADVLLTRNNPHGFLNPAPIDFHCDFNRDGRVNATDMLIARSNQTHLLSALKLIHAPGGKSAAGTTETIPETALQQEAWLYELDPLGTSDDTAQEPNQPDEAVDALWATYWS